MSRSSSVNPGEHWSALAASTPSREGEVAAAGEQRGWFSKPIWGGLLLLAALFVAYYWGARHLTLDWFVSRELQLRAYLHVHPWQGLCYGFMTFVVASLIPGTKGKAIIWGWLFGLWTGLLLVNFGLTTAALISFVASRYWFRDYLVRRFRGFMERLDRALEREGGWYLFVLRLIAGIPFTFVNYAMGATAIRTRTFWWATQFGILPGNLLFVYVGAQLPTLNKLAERGWTSLVAPRVVVAAALLALAPLVVRWLFKRYADAGPLRTGSRLG